MSTEDHLFATEANRVRLDAFERRMDRLEERLEENTQATNQVRANTDLLVEITQAFRGLAKVLSWIARAFKPIAGAAAAAASAYLAWRSSK